VTVEKKTKYSISYALANILRQSLIKHKYMDAHSKNRAWSAAFADLYQSRDRGAGRSGYAWRGCLANYCIDFFIDNHLL